MSGSVKLLGCPWCDAPAAFDVNAARKCHAIYCSGPNECVHMDGDLPDLVDLWNTRAPDPAVAALEAEVARLREALQPFADAAEHLHPAHSGDALTLDAIKVSAWRAAWSALNPATSEKEAG